MSLRNRLSAPGFTAVREGQFLSTETSLPKRQFLVPGFTAVREGQFLFTETRPPKRHFLCLSVTFSAITVPGLTADPHSYTHLRVTAVPALSCYLYSAIDSSSGKYEGV